MDMSFHHRVTQSLTEFYFFDFKLIKLCDTLCYSVVKRVRLQPFFYDIPVDDLPQFVYVVGTTVLIVEVVSMFPYVKSQ